MLGWFCVGEEGRILGKVEFFSRRVFFLWNPFLFCILHDIRVVLQVMISDSLDASFVLAIIQKHFIRSHFKTCWCAVTQHKILTVGM